MSRLRPNETPRRGTIYRLSWWRSHWGSREPNQRVYLTRAAALARAERLERSGAVVEVHCAERTPWREVRR